MAGMPTDNSAAPVLSRSAQAPVVGFGDGTSHYSNASEFDDSWDWDSDAEQNSEPDDAPSAEEYWLLAQAIGWANNIVIVTLWIAYMLLLVIADPEIYAFCIVQCLFFALSVRNFFWLRLVSGRFVYDPLPSDKIRLLRILPGYRTEPISCILAEAAIDDNDFVAVSYVWEQQGWRTFITKHALTTFLMIFMYHCTPLKYLRRPFGIRPGWYRNLVHRLVSGLGARPILCNGQRLWVTENLHHFLLEMRGSDEQYWIDAICVHQQDPVERSHSVVLMSSIYTKAKHVIAWLGRCPTLYDYPHIMGSIQMTVDYRDKDPGGFIPFLCLSARSLARTFVFQVPYFKRIWILQECIMPKNLVFRVGRYEFPVAQIEQAVEHVDGDNDRVASARSVLRGRRDFQQNGSWSVAKYLLAAQGHEGHDDRDLIHAGLGLCEMDLVPSYTAAAKEPFLVCGQQLLKEQGLLALSFACAGHSGWIDLPSWVPHFHVLGDLQSMVSTRFNAGGPGRYEVQGCRLRVDSQNSDTIARVLANGIGQVEPIDVLLQLLELGTDATGEWILTATARMFNADTLDAPTTRLWNMLERMMSMGRRQSEIMSGITTWMSLVASLVPTEMRNPLAKWQRVVRLINSHLAENDRQPQVEMAELAEKAHSLMQELRYAEPRKMDDLTCLIRNSEPPRPLGNLMQLGRPTMANEMFDLEEDPYRTLFIELTSQRKVFVTEQGYIGLGSKYIEKGDSVMVIAGAQMPYVLRGVENGYRLVGEAYVQGLMYGEALREGSSANSVVIV